MRIRSLTYHIGNKYVDQRQLINEVQKIYEIKDALRSSNIKNVWSYRVVVPIFPIDVDYLKIAKIIENFKDIFFSLIHEDVMKVLKKRKLYSDIVSILRTYRNMFVALRASSKSLHVIPKLYFLISKDVEPANVSRLAIAFSNFLETPYFPLAASLAQNSKVTLSLLYVKDFKEYINHNRCNGKNGKEILCDEVRNLEAQLISILHDIKVTYGGIDLSLSPWMEESVGNLIEEIARVKIPLPGTLSAIKLINKEIIKLRKCVKKSIGFNELMLPIAEDNILKMRVKEGLLRFAHLTYLASICVAGVDMVVLPGNVGEELIYGVSKDLYFIAKTKKKPQGLRLIIYHSAFSGDEVNLGLFGNVPVIYI